MAVLRFPIVLLLSDEKPTAAGETQKGVLAFCRVKSWVASVRWWADRLRVLDERQADERKCNYNWWNVWFHIRGVSEKSRQLVEALLLQRLFGFRLNRRRSSIICRRTALAARRRGRTSASDFASRLTVHSHSDRLRPHPAQKSARTDWVAVECPVEANGCSLDVITRTFDSTGLTNFCPPTQPRDRVLSRCFRWSWRR